MRLLHLGGQTGGSGAALTDADGASGQAGSEHHGQESQAYADIVHDPPPEALLSWAWNQDSWTAAMALPLAWGAAISKT
jgi:hypothetical protein